MATNTNYTTKTAALKATKADMRQVAVSKKIEIGSGDTATKITDVAVSAEDLLVSVEGKNERQSVKSLISTAETSAKTAASDALAEAKGELTEAIGAVSDKVDNMKLGIDIGNEDTEGEEEGVDNIPHFANITKLSFMGEYVNVIDNEDGTATLYIQPNTSAKVYNTMTGAPGATKYYIADYGQYLGGMPVTAGSQHGVTALVNGTGNFSSVTLKAVGTDNSEVFTIKKKTTKIWWKVNDSEWQSQALNVGTDGVDSAYIGNVTKENVKLTVSGTKIWTKDDAATGKVPNQIQTSFNFVIDINTITGGKGGTVNFYYAVQETEPVDGEFTTVAMFATRSINPTLGTCSATMQTTDVKTKTVSGLNYLIKGNVYTVSCDAISNTQNLAYDTTDRIKVSGCGGTAATYKRDSDKLTRTDTTSPTNVNAYDAKYSFTDSYTVGEIGTPGSTNQLTFQTFGIKSDPTQSVTIQHSDKYWGAATSGTTDDDKEAFKDESKRLHSYDASTGATVAKTAANFDGTTDAVVQNGYLYHPNHIYATTNDTTKLGYRQAYSGGTSDGGTWSATATQGEFLRVFKNTNTAAQAKVTFTADTQFYTDINNGNVEVYMQGINADGSLEGKWWSCHKTAAEDGVAGCASSKSGKLEVTLRGLKFAGKNGCLVKFVIKGKTTRIAPITATFA